MDRENCMAVDAPSDQTDFGYTLSVIGGKYKMTILYWIAECEVILSLIHI